MIFSEEYSKNSATLDWVNYVEEQLPVGNLRMWGYIQGYKNVADLATENCMGTALQDSFVFPIVFLYRHYVEIVLKNILQNSDIGNADKSKVSGRHDLYQLFIVVKPYLLKSGFSEKDVCEIEELCLEFDKHDKFSTSFRYPYKKDNEAPNVPKQLYINLDRLKKKINKFDDILYGTYDHFI